MSHYTRRQDESRESGGIRVMRLLIVVSEGQEEEREHGRPVAETPEYIRQAKAPAHRQTGFSARYIIMPE
ncbi:unnamed protein product [Protopolystoma xenopodis]|uniref:Uncharacterized protein n=1 Tax=Protopolystoma xenopodis TaxID=117903 RepID=A0A3S5B9Y4_9PLAT|nr:unnamed protein product [Protopolystoma xenopodis]